MYASNFPTTPYMTEWVRKLLHVRKKNNESNSRTTIDALTTLTKEDFDNMWEFLDIKVNGALYDIMPDEIFNIYCG